jgi:hypothetical protein
MNRQETRFGSDRTFEPRGWLLEARVTCQNQERAAIWSIKFKED